MNCSEFDCSEFEQELERLVEARETVLQGPALQHAEKCAPCRIRWNEHRLMEAALVAWRPVSCPPTLAESVLRDILNTERPALGSSQKPSAGRFAPNETRSRWMTVVVAAACLCVTLGLSFSVGPRADRNDLVSGPRDVSVAQVLASADSSVEVASSVAAVLEDLRSEYRDLAAETTATARDLAVALPVAPVAPWMESSPANSPSEAVESGIVGEGPVSVIGRSIGIQIGQAMDFLRVAVPQEIPRG